MLKQLYYSSVRLCRTICVRHVCALRQKLVAQEIQHHSLGCVVKVGSPTECCCLAPRSYPVPHAAHKKLSHYQT